jgi:hypothetical protein
MKIISVNSAFEWFAYFAVHLISARQVSGVELNSPKHLSYDIQSQSSFGEDGS